MMDLGFAFKTPISWLKDRDRTRLRQVLLGLPTPEAKAFYGAFLHPPIDQVVLFDKYQIPSKNRKGAQNAARTLLLDNSGLAIRESSSGRLTECWPNPMEASTYEQPDRPPR